MRILLEKFVLCDHGDHHQLAINGQRAVDVQTFLRGAYARPVSRDNLLNTITLSCQREHASYAAAEVFMMNHIENCPAEGVLTMEALKDNGGVIKLYILNAVIQSPNITPKGVRTLHDYTIIGDKVISQKP